MRETLKIVLNQIENKNEIEITCIYAFQSISVYGTFSITIRLMTNSAAKKCIGVQPFAKPNNITWMSQ